MPRPLISSTNACNLPRRYASRDYIYVNVSTAESIVIQVGLIRKLVMSGSETEASVESGHVSGTAGSMRLAERLSRSLVCVCNAVRSMMRVLHIVRCCFVSVE